MKDICEAKRAGQWVEVTIEDALALGRNDLLRCVECHGRVRAHRESNNGMRAHFEHGTLHRGCSRGSGFNGSASLHPDRLD